MQNRWSSRVRNFLANKWAKILLVVDIMIVIIFAVIFIIDSKRTAKLELNVVPVKSQISVNGDTNYSNGIYRLFPGIYEISVSYPGMNTKVFTVDLSHQDVATVTTFLSGDDNFDYYRLRDNYDEFVALSKIAESGHNQTTDQDFSAGDFVADYQRNYYLYTTQLPATYADYGDDDELIKYVTVRSSDSCEILLCLKAFLFDENDKQLANSLLEGKGFNIKDFEIQYEIY